MENRSIARVTSRSSNGGWGYEGSIASATHTYVRHCLGPEEFLLVSLEAATVDGDMKIRLLLSTIPLHCILNSCQTLS